MTFEAAFKKLLKKFDNVEVEKLEDMAIQITLSDEDCGGTFYAAVKNKTLSVEPYDYKDNDAVLDITASALTSILDGKTSFDDAVENGNATIKGNLEKLAVLKNSIKAPEKKAVKKEVEPTEVKRETIKTVSKTAEIKAAVKKEEPKKTVKSTSKKTTVTTAAKRTAKKVSD